MLILEINNLNLNLVLFTNNRKIKGFYNPRVFGTELKMTDQVKYLGVILEKKLDWKAQSLHCILAVSSCYGKDLGIITKGGGLAIHFRSEAHPFVCFASMVEESEAEKYSEKALSPYICSYNKRPDRRLIDC
jgi:hypothetical protein